ncbi:3-hydroxyacyl-CoA dehydrogenase NAD-binding domain-containing protein [Nocardioides sp. Bht2]|uniref:3-hydroxyacyl-CoA dehydrogenase NAD-binding domain-containing protein n=1 Tax=Nocardioides sp. Bht2 TaxID=3392297 RepID=UPI0039B46766
MSDLTHFTVTAHDDVRLVVLDVPGRSMNVIDEAVLTELRNVVDEFLADDEAHGLVLASGKSGSFGGGADLNSLPALAGDSHTPTFLARTHELMELMADAAKPMVVAIDGYALGGAFEVALGGSSIVATERSVLGLPESTLGLIPGGGGTQLVLNRVPAHVAVELMVSGRSVSAATAAELGLIDELVPAEKLIDTALELARGSRVIRSHPSLTPAEIAAALDAAGAVRRPPSAAAAAAVVECVEVGLRSGRAAGLAAERAAFQRVLSSSESAALVHLFHVETAAKRRFRGAGGSGSIGVVGAGQMGAGIAATAVSHGLSAVVRDIDADRIAEAQNRAATSPEAEQLWRGTTEWVGFADVDVVVEAVFESPELKRETLQLIDAEVGPDTLITTNTSAIPVASLSDAVSRPARFLGTHFFSPVEKMALVELVPHRRSADDAVEKAGRVARMMGKVPVVVADYPGFYTSRVYARWLIEGLRLLADGADPAAIEAEARAVGFPVGPLQASDEVTLDLVLAASVVQVAEQVLTERVDVLGIKALLERLIADGFRGKRFGKGFYCYRDGRRDGLDPAVLELVGASGGSVAPGQAGERLLLAFVTESIACWDDATLCHPDDGDLAAVLGIGFPRALGGPFHWADQQGAATVLERCRGLDPQAFPVGESLTRLAASAGRFAEEGRRERPGIV